MVGAGAGAAAGAAARCGGTKIDCTPTNTVGVDAKFGASRAARSAWTSSTERPWAWMSPARGTLMLPSGATSALRFSPGSSSTSMLTTSPGLSA